MVARNSMAEQRINHVAPRSAGCTRDVTSDSLACFAGVTDAGGNPLTIIVGARQPKHLSEFKPAKAALRNPRAASSEPTTPSTLRSVARAITQPWSTDSTVASTWTRFNSA